MQIIHEVFIYIQKVIFEQGKNMFPVQRFLTGPPVMWDVTASVWSVTDAMGAITGAGWAVNALYGILKPLCGLLQRLCGL